MNAVDVQAVYSQTFEQRKLCAARWVWPRRNNKCPNRYRYREITWDEWFKIFYGEDYYDYVKRKQEEKARAAVLVPAQPDVATDPAGVHGGVQQPDAGVHVPVQPGQSAYHSWRDSEMRAGRLKSRGDFQ